MRRKLVALVLAVVLIFGSALTANAYTLGILEYDLLLGRLQAGSDAVYSEDDGLLEIKAGGIANYDEYIPFNHAGVTIDYQAETDGKFTVSVEGRTTTGDIKKGTNSLKLTYKYVERIGGKPMSFSSTVPVKISYITFNKENVDNTNNGREKPLPALTEFEQQLETTVIFGLKASIYKFHNARRYIDNANINLTPKVVGGVTYLPIHTISRSLGYYYEYLEDEQFILFRIHDMDYFYKDGKCYIKEGYEKSKLSDVQFIKFIDGEPYAPLRYFAEKAGFWVGFREGVIVIDDRVLVRNIIEDDETFAKVKAEITSFIPNSTVGKTYYVAQTPNASDKNDGSKEHPWLTLNHAGAVAQKGDTVIIGEGTYREVFTPQNNGTADSPITFKAAEGENVVISAAEKVSGFTTYDKEKNIVSKVMKTDLGRGRNMVYYKGEALAEGRHPNTHTKNRTPQENLPLGPLWPTQGDFYGAEPKGSAVTSPTDLGQPNDYWKGATCILCATEAWALCSAIVEESTPEKLIFNDVSKSNTWWFGYTVGPERYYFGYITHHLNTVDLPGEWYYANKILYINPPEGETADTLELEYKARQICVDLTGRKFVHLVGINTFAGSMKLNETEMCMLEGGEYKYISHFTDAEDYRDGWITTNNKGQRDGEPIKGEIGIYDDGTENIYVNNHFNWSAATALYLTGKYSYIENNIISDCGYAGAYFGGIFVNNLLWERVEKPVGGHSIYANTVYNAGRAVYEVGSSHNSFEDVTSPYLPDEIAYNDFHNGSVCTRDNGVVYLHGASTGNDKIMQKMHHNYVYDSWSHDGYNMGIYYDNYTRMAECYNNIVFSTDPYSHIDGDANMMFIQQDAFIYTWGNSLLGDFYEGLDGLNPTHFQYDKPFYAGALQSQTEKYLENYNNIDKYYTDKYYYVKDANLTQGITLDRGRAQFDPENYQGECIEFKNVDFGEEYNSINIYYTADNKKTSNEFTVRVGPSYAEAKATVMTAPFDYTSPTPEGEASKKTVIYGCPKGINNVYIEPSKWESVKISKIELTHTDVDPSIITKIDAGSYTSAKSGAMTIGTKYIEDGYVDPLDKTVTHNGGSVKMANNTWGGAVFHYKIGLSQPTKYMIMGFGTITQKVNGCVAKIRVGSPDAEPIGEAILMGTNKSFGGLGGWDNHKRYGITLTEEIPAGIHDIYVTWHGEYTGNWTFMSFNSDLSMADYPVNPETHMAYDSTIKITYDSYDPKVNTNQLPPEEAVAYN